MKKNTMMRIASTLLIAVLLTTCAIGATFAKYVTTDTATDTAKVAKWGVTVTVPTDTADLDQFNTFYTKTDTSYTVGDNIVVASTTYNLVAPGTSKDAAAVITITGTPEVAVNVKTEATLTLTGWTVETENDYCPVVFTVGTKTYAMGDTAVSTGDNLVYTSVADLVAAVEAALEVDTDYAHNTALASTDDRTFGWSWAFEGTDGAFQTDVKDTALGDLAVTAAPSITLTITATVTQID